MKLLFEYMNYRDYLREFYEEKKRTSPFYSFRLFSQKAGFKSPNFLKLVIDNKRNLTKESALKFSQALAHNKRESEYFENLVFFNQSPGLDEKNYYLARLMRFRTQNDPQKIEQSEYAYLSQWYHPVIRELVTASDVKGDFKKLGQMVIPAISATEAEKSVALLCDLKFIERTANGSYTRTKATLTTGFQIQSVGAANYHKAMIHLGADAIERFPSAKRDIESLTLSVSEDTYTTIIGRMQQMSLELLQLAEADKNSTMVAQVNFQIFPLSQTFPRAGGAK